MGIPQRLKIHIFSGKNMCKAIIGIFFTLSLIIGISYQSQLVGEWPSYALVTVSFINDGNPTISREDVIKAKELLPEWSQYMDFDHLSVSPYFTSGGDAISWYFFTYSLACVPVMLLLRLLHIPLITTFVLTNILIYTLSLLIVTKYSRIRDDKKVLLLLMLTINPCVLYLVWTSAEIFIFSFITLGMVFWLNRSYKLAALFSSIAASLNPVLLLLCFFIGIDFLIQWFEKHSIKTVKQCISEIKKDCLSLLILACCFIPAFVPLVYNLFLVGNINITAQAGFTDLHGITGRFIAYLFDLNFGFLPYFSFVFLLFLVMFIFALFKKNRDIILYSITFFLIVFSYCLIGHINCGLAGIARYNAWSSVIMIFIVVYHYDVIWSSVGRIIAKTSIVLTLTILSIILWIYGPISGGYMYMTPWVSALLDTVPELYNPLHSTFNSRVNHIDGGYSYNLPIYYMAQEESVKKILLDETSVQNVKNSLYGSSNDLDWLYHKLDSVTTEQYLSIGVNRKLQKLTPYWLGDIIWFSGDSWNGDLFTTNGISGNEDNFTWTDGHDVQFLFAIKNFDNSKNYTVSISIAGVFNNSQRVNVWENKSVIYDTIVNSPADIEFSIAPSDSGIVDFTLVLPDAVSPEELGLGNDNRILGISLIKATITTTGE